MIISMIQMPAEKSIRAAVDAAIRKRMMFNSSMKIFYGKER
jgi:hypothetical protein